jgi:deoxyhypusine synthase
MCHNCPITPPLTPEEEYILEFEDKIFELLKKYFPERKLSELYEMTDKVGEILRKEGWIE